MNMNKKVLLIVISVFALFGFSSKVFAYDCEKYGCATCVYQDNTFKFTYDMKSDENGNPKIVSFTPKVLVNNQYGKMTYVLNEDLRIENFINSHNKLFCPEKLYIKYTAGSTNVVGEVLPNSEKGVKEVSLKTDESSNNNLEVNDPDSCNYTASVGNGGMTVKISVFVENNQLKYNLSDGFKITNWGEISVDDFANGNCPELYSFCGASGDNKFCTLSKEKLGVQQDAPSAGEKEEAAGTVQEEMKDKTCPEGYELVDGDCIIPGYVGENVCSQPEVKKVLSMAGYILILVKVIIPLIIIVIGSFDLYQAVTGKDEKALSKSLKTLGLRLALGVFIFFIPSLVDWAFGMYYEATGQVDNQCVNCLFNPSSCD